MNEKLNLITAGATYLDIDAYACMVALAELMQLRGENAIAYSKAPTNYSVCQSLVEEGQILYTLPVGVREEDAEYILVDISDPEFLKDTVPLDRVVAVYDHHVGFEQYWQNRIGEAAQIEFIGAAATMIFREWKTNGLQEKMTRSTARLLIAAILDNTLNLTSANTTQEDRDAFAELCQMADVGAEFCAAYFSEVQVSVEQDLKNALFGDIKEIRGSRILPERMAQICVWNAKSVLSRLPEIVEWFATSEQSWMVNIIDIQEKCSYFVCYDAQHQKEIETIFDVEFHAGLAKCSVSYLRKEIIKKTRIEEKHGGSK